MTAPIEILAIRRPDGGVKPFVEVRFGCIVIHDRRVIQQPGQKAWVALREQPECLKGRRLHRAGCWTSCETPCSRPGNARRIGHRTASSRRANKQPWTDPAPTETSRERRPLDVSRAFPAGWLHLLRRHRPGRDYCGRELQRRRYKPSRDVDQEPEPGTQLLLYGERDATRSAQKAAKDVTEIAALWSDIDPLDSDGRSWGDERKRLEALADELHALEKPPTFITDSGSGIQPLWLLAEPIEANPEYRQAAESLCARIETALGAKRTHNCDRLLRVPGTRNFPNARKRKLGRGETQARLLHATWRRYSWRELETSPRGSKTSRLSMPSGSSPEPGQGPRTQPILTCPSEPPKPLEPERLKQLRDRHRGLFDLARYDGDQSRQDLAVASLARRLGWPPVGAWRLIIAVRDDQKAYRRDYIERTLGRAYAEHADEDEEDEFTPDAGQQGRTTSSLPVIAILPGKLSERTTAVGALRTARLQIFDPRRAARAPVRVALQSRNPRWCAAPGRCAGIAPGRAGMAAPALLAETAIWRKWDSRAGQWRAADPPHDVPRTLTVAPDGRMAIPARCRPASGATPGRATYHRPRL